MCLWKSDDTPIVMITNMKVAILAFQEWWVVTNRCVEDGEGGPERERDWKLEGGGWEKEPNCLFLNVFQSAALDLFMPNDV